MQVRCRGGGPGAQSSSATGGELRQSRLVLGFLRLEDRLPALAWIKARGELRGEGRGSGPASGSGAGVGQIGLGLAWGQGEW